MPVEQRETERDRQRDRDRETETETKRERERKRKGRTIIIRGVKSALDICSFLTVPQIQNFDMTFSSRLFMNPSF